MLYAASRISTAAISFFMIDFESFDRPQHSYLYISISIAQV